MEFTISVVCAVESDEKSFTLDMAKEAAKQAVENALKQVSEMGFQHNHADFASISIVEVKNVDELDEPFRWCEACKSYHHPRNPTCFLLTRPKETPKAGD